MSQIQNNHPSTPNQQRPSQSNEINKRAIYARRVNKSTIKVIFDLPTKIADLKSTISKRFKFENDNFLLFCEGKQLTLQEQLTDIKNEAIVHIVSIDCNNQSQLKIFFREIDSEQSIEALVNKDEQIKHYFQSEIKNKIDKSIQQVFLIYLGKTINPNLTFAQAFVENQCEILITKIIKKLQLPNSIIAISQSHQIVKEDYKPSVILGMPYKESRTLVDHQNFKKKQIQKLNKLKTKHSSMFLQKKIEEKSPENQEVPSQIIAQMNFKNSLGLQSDLSFEMGKLKIDEQPPQNEQKQQKTLNELAKGFTKNKKE